jgi:ComEC/Rec2-related protein
MLNNTPLLFPLISLILGIYWQQAYAFNNIILTAACSILFFAIILFNKRVTLKSLQIFSCALFFFGGADLLQNQRNEHYNILKNIKNKKINAIAKVNNKEKGGPLKTTETLKLTIQQVKDPTQGTYKKTNFNIVCYTQANTNIQISDKIELKNLPTITLSKNKALTNNPSFDDYLIKENILTTIFTNDLNYEILNTPNYSLNRWLLNKKNSLCKQIKTKLTPTTRSLFFSIFLGNKKDKTLNRIKKDFGCWGISHYLARSGLHIILFILIWTFLLNLLPLNFVCKRIILLIVCFIYLFLSWTSISFIRAFMVFVFFEIGKLFQQQTLFLHLLMMTCLVILLFNPMQLFFLDFQLSFALTFALAGLNMLSTNLSS